jgi:hypothetical protein
MRRYLSKIQGTILTRMVFVSLPRQLLGAKDLADACYFEPVSVEVMAKGIAGTLFLATDNCQAAYEELKGRGVEFVETPVERPYGIDSAFRDPSGNNIRLTQLRQMATV